MLRINEEAGAGNVARLRLEGRLIDQWVGLLRAVCEKILAMGVELSLDLTEVTFADTQGVRLLRELTKLETAHLSCSPLLDQQIHSFTGELRLPELTTNGQEDKDKE